MTADEKAAARVADAQQVILLALECSLYRASGPDYGLTLEELGDLAARFGRNKAQVLAVANDLLAAAYLTRTADRRLRFLPGEWRFTRFDTGYLIPERRPIDGLDTVVRVLRNQTSLPRAQLIAEGTRPIWGVVADRLSLAIEILLLAGVVREKDGSLQLTGKHLEGPLPSELLKSRQSQGRDPLCEELWSGVEAVLHERRQRAAREARELDQAKVPERSGAPPPNKPNTGASTQMSEPRTKTTNILFLDVEGWSKLDASQVHSYVTTALPALGECLQGRDFQNTWGDAVVATFGSAKEAAESALRIRDFFRQGTPARGVAPGLTCRISLHQGEVLLCANPLIGRDDIFGESVHLAARLEPVTQPGFVFCTRSFADALGALGNLAPKAWPLGVLALAKRSGQTDVFVVTDPNDVDPRPQLTRASTASESA